MGSQGLPGLKEFFLGSVSHGVLHHAHCPVLIAGGKGKEYSAGGFQRLLLGSVSNYVTHHAPCPVLVVR